MYIDERGYELTDEDLQAEYTSLRANNETDCETYSQYVSECCGKHGTLTRKE
jgi:hypothetical protein